MRGEWTAMRTRNHTAGGQFAIFNLSFAICILNLSLAHAEPVPGRSRGWRAVLRRNSRASMPNWQLTFIADHTRKTMPAADLVYWGQCAGARQGRPRFWPTADCSVADVRAADKDNLTIESDSFGVVKLPLESLAGVVFHLPSARRDRDQLLDRIAMPAATPTACYWTTATSWPGSSRGSPTTRSS